MYDIVLHVGLPKTATTSFQDNVLIPLHESGMINLLDINFLFSKDISKTEFEKLLMKDKLNVISEERITETDKNNYELFVERLSKLLLNYNVKTIISLRQPIDFIYSYYIQTYSQVFSQYKTLNTFQKFIKEVELNQDEPMFKMFFFSKFLSYLKEKFGKLNILFYEDLKYARKTYFNTLSELIKIDSEKLEEMFSKEVKNIKTSSSNGKFSRELRLTEVLKIQRIKDQNKLLYNVLKYGLIIELIRFLDKFLYKLLNKKQILHEYPNEEEISKLSDILLSGNERLNSEFNLSIDKLKQYNYLINK